MHQARLGSGAGRRDRRRHRKPRPRDPQRTAPSHSEPRARARWRLDDSRASREMVSSVTLPARCKAAARSASSRCPASSAGARGRSTRPMSATAKATASHQQALERRCIHASPEVLRQRLAGGSVHAARRGDQAWRSRNDSGLSRWRGSSRARKGRKRAPLNALRPCSPSSSGSGPGSGIAAGASAPVSPLGVEAAVSSTRPLTLRSALEISLGSGWKYSART